MLLFISVCRLLDFLYYYILAAPSTIQQEGKCRVYQKRYLKCAFRAPGFARALANDYPVDFQFTEMTRM